MRNRLLRNTLGAIAAGLSVGVLAVGCSSSSPSSSSNVPASTLSGIYVTNSVGGIQQFEFVDSSHVNVWWASCASGKPCEANDTYTMNGDQLVISEPGGNTTKIILSGMQNGVGPAYDRLHPLGGVSLGVSLGGDSGTSLTVSLGDASLTSGETITLVITFTITIVIEDGDGGLSLLGGDAGTSEGGATEGGATEGGATEGGVMLTSDGAVSLQGDGSAPSEGGATGDAAVSSSGSASSGTGSSSGNSSGSASSATGSSSRSGSSSGMGSSSTSSSASSSSHKMICSNVTQQTFKSASTFPNDKTSFDFLLSQGLNATQAAGVVGNLDQESGDSPTCYQGPNGCSSSPVSGYPGAGIAQWSRGGRWDTDKNDNAKAYATQQGESVSSLQLQLQFLWYELSSFSHDGLSPLKQQSTISGAGQIFASDFEACGTCDQTNRTKYAQNAYNAFSNDKTQSTGMPAGMCIQNYGTCSANGSSGSCIDKGSCSSIGGTSSAGHCPGPSNIQCCTQ
jgi:hypothetical protein